MTKKALLFLPLLALAACNGGDAGTSVTNSPGGNSMNGTMDGSMEMPANSAVIGMESAPAPTDATTYLAKAGAGDKFEIESSRAILDKTQNADIKSFAQMMIDDHGTATAKLKSAAQAAKLTAPPPVLEPKQQQAVDSIKSADGAAADRAYLDAQKTAHQEALALHQGYAAGGDTAQLKTAAGEIAPVVQHHIEMLAKIKV